MSRHTFVFDVFRLTVLTGCCLSSFAATADDRPWSFQPVRRHATPVVQTAQWPQCAVDHFVLAKLEGRDLHPSPHADRRTLIRRVTFDLTGLPPTPEEIDEFLKDQSPDSLARLIDRLLASPRYGQRWGRHWLDVVRYADARDLIQLPVESDFREAWRYRDWVVSAFNHDLPYDEFVRRQIAGDLMQPQDPSRIDIDALVATGMLAIADFVPGDVDKQQMIADYVNDQIDVVGRAVLALTLACARCHDHKFDPITIDDYYSLAGIFFSTRLVPGPVKGNTPLVRVPLISAAEIAARDAELVRHKARLAELTGQVDTLADQQYRSYLERQVSEESSRYLQGACEFVHSSDSAKPGLADFAKARVLQQASLSRWIQYFQEPRPHPAFEAVRGATTITQARELAQQLASGLSDEGKRRSANTGHAGPASPLVPTETFRFRADDRRLAADETQHIKLWPNRGQTGTSAVPVAETTSPITTAIEVNGRSMPAVRFGGKDMLQAAGSVPTTGTLIVVFRPDPKGGAGQRLVGWEDSSVGQHGLGIMTDGSGSLHIIVRRNGASGDVVVPALTGDAASGFQNLCVTWGPGGVFVHRNGQNVGANNTINSVSSDPEITQLHIGGPGSGGSARFQGDIAELRIFATPIDNTQRTSLESVLTDRWIHTLDAKPSPEESLADLYDELISPRGPFQLDDSEREKLLTDEFRQRLSQLRHELEELKKTPPPPEIPRAVVVQDGGPVGTPHEGFHDAVVYLRGNHTTPGHIVPRGVPKALTGAEPLAIAAGSGRRELAAWLTRPDNPLTSRVMVNRIWQHHFGAGLVRTSANLGMMGEVPSHPELLDFLAIRFVESGWSIKSLHRTILLSSAYQQSSTPQAPATLTPDTDHNQKGLAIDPENRLLWRANRRRLESEAFRDSLLEVAGRMDDTMEGPGFQEVTRPRRSLYLMAVRTGAKTAEFGPLFDAADCTGIVERRTESIVAPQALYLMNDPMVLDLASSLATRVSRDMPTGAQRDVIRRVYEIVLGRLPQDAETEIGSQLLGDGRFDELMRYCHLILCTNEFLYVD